MNIDLTEAECRLILSRIESAISSGTQYLNDAQSVKNKMLQHLANFDRPNAVECGLHLLPR